LGNSNQLSRKWRCLPLLLDFSAIIAYLISCVRLGCVLSSVNINNFVSECEKCWFRGSDGANEARNPYYSPLWFCYGLKTIVFSKGFFSSSPYIHQLVLSKSFHPTLHLFALYSTGKRLVRQSFRIVVIRS